VNLILVLINMTTVNKTDLLDHQSSDVYGESCTTSFDIEHRETTHVPVGPSSLAKINLVDDAGDCNAHSYKKMSPPSGKISTFGMVLYVGYVYWFTLCDKR